MITHPVLTRLAASGVKLGLERMQSFLVALGEPHRAYPVVHVAGTNGKGSTCTLVTHALVAAGYRVGTNLSPHVEHVNERFRIDGVPIDDASLVSAIEHLDRTRSDWSEQVSAAHDGREALTYFEFATALAFQLFAQRGVQIAVIEVGMGGRLDATNVVSPNVCAIPSIGLDHMAELGDTVEAIAGEKAGVIKRGGPVVIGVMPEGARQVLERRAKAVGVPIWRPGPDLQRELRKGRWNLRTPEGRLDDVALALQGEHQGNNALVALGVLHVLRRQGFVIPDDAIRDGFGRATLEGRLETPMPGLVIDGAHNEDGAKVLARWLATRPRPKNRILLLGMGRERDPLTVVGPLLPHFDEVVTTACAHPKAADPAALAARLQELDIVLAEGGPIEEALPEVYAEADETVVAGSLFLAGAARAVVRSGALQGITPGGR